jgi:crossover junction endodeoxyribonuclease RuvC
MIKTSPAMETPQRLQKLNNDLSKLIKEYKPEILAIERLYFFRNLKTAIPVSQACGVILLTAAKNKIPVRSFTPLEVKAAVAGHGWAEKELVQKNVKKMLNLKEIFKSDDAADALAIAITYYIKES